MSKHVEMIIDYVTDGDDFLYNDNHGVLIRCKDCKNWIRNMFECSINPMDWKPNEHCSKAVAKA